MRHKAEGCHLMSDTGIFVQLLLGLICLLSLLGKLTSQESH